MVALHLVVYKHARSHAHSICANMAKFVHPSTWLVAGPTGSGKTQWIAEVLRHDFIAPKPERIVWVYAEWQTLYDKIRMLIPLIEFVKSAPDNLYETLDPKRCNLLVMDDQMAELGDSRALSSYFTKGSHHRNTSVIYIVQNLFDKGKSQRTVSLNTQYLVVFKNPRDAAQIEALGRQMYPHTPKFLAEVFADATRKPYSYLLIDLRPETPEQFRLRTNVLPIEASNPTVYKQSSRARSRR